LTRSSFFINGNRQIKDSLYDDEVREHIIAMIKTAKKIGRGFGGHGTSKTVDSIQDVEETIDNPAIDKNLTTSVNVTESKSTMAEFDALMDGLLSDLEGRPPSMIKSLENEDSPNSLNESIGLPTHGFC
jgi:hypothetical protein